MTNFEIETKLRQVYQSLKDEFDIQFKYHLYIVISNRLRSSNGTCTYQRWRPTREILYAKITMSKPLLEEFGWEAFEQTFRHEVAHLANALLGGENHDKSFIRLCIQFGGTISLKKSHSQFAKYACTKYVNPIIRYIYTCPCGHQKKMAKRMSRKKRGNSRYRCGKCGIHTLDTWTESRVA